MDPVTIGMLLLGGGKLLSGIGGRRTANATIQADRAEDMRQEAEARARAKGRSALMRGILNANGYGGTMTDEQIEAMLLRTGRRGTARAPSVLGAIGGGASTIGDLMLTGSAGREAEAEARRNRLWDLDDEIVPYDGPRPR